MAIKENDTQLFLTKVELCDLALSSFKYTGLLFQFINGFGFSVEFTNVKKT